MIANDFYVYVYFRPNGIPCYVGKGRGSRWVKHKNGECCNIHLKRIIKKAGGDLPRVKIRTGLSNEHAVEIECALIAAIGRQKDGGPLVNFSKGGDGVPGHRPSEATREKLRAAHRNRDPEASRIRGCKISEKLKDQKKSDEARAAMSAAKQNRTPEEKAEFARKVSVGKLGGHLSPEGLASRLAKGAARVAATKQRKAERRKAEKIERSKKPRPQPWNLGKPMAEEQKQKLRGPNPNKRVPHGPMSDATKAKMRDACLNRPWSTARRAAFEAQHP